MDGPARLTVQHKAKFLDLGLKVSKRSAASLQAAIENARCWEKRVTITINGTEYEVALK